MKNHGIDGDFCLMCQYECQSVDELRIHMQKHKTAGKNQCVVCDKNMSRKSGLIAHVKIHVRVDNIS